MGLQNLQFFFGGDPAKLSNFWRALSSGKRPAEEHLEHTIPVKLFGDGVAVLGLAKSWSKTVHAFLMCPLLSGLSGKDTQILITILWKARLSPAAYRKFWSLLSWSLDSLHKGVWPEVDMFGRAFPAGSISHFG